MMNGFDWITIIVEVTVIVIEVVILFKLREHSRELHGFLGKQAVELEKHTIKLDEHVMSLDKHSMELEEKINRLLEENESIYKRVGLLEGLIRRFLVVYLSVHRHPGTVG